jgi:hypothetical protein
MESGVSVSLRNSRYYDRRRPNWRASLPHTLVGLLAGLMIGGGVILFVAIVALT